MRVTVSPGQPHAVVCTKHDRSLLKGIARGCVQRSVGVRSFEQWSQPSGNNGCYVATGSKHHSRARASTKGLCRCHHTRLPTHPPTPTHTYLFSRRNTWYRSPLPFTR